ncbi:MAG: Smr/MutS family protein [Sphingomonadales bacterium]|nr:Smr/MutS family protein [Sphingomonadales bacterium]MDE2168679.1 Smr/MutS family protein [Sphingomonadales bacterium]
MKGPGRAGFRPAHRVRSLTPEEAALWAKLAETVTPLEPRRRAAPVAQPLAIEAAVPPAPPKRVKGRVPPPLPPAPPPAAPARPLDRHGLDAGWDKRLAKGQVAPDFSLDLHGFTLDEAYARLDDGLTLARSQGARLVLLVTGRPRPQNGPSSRGVIRARVADWLALGPHGSAIAAVRGAHVRHGGAGALYIILKRQR